MDSIDFLPPEYHQQHAQRQVQPWRIVVVAVYVLLLTAAAMTQYRQQRRPRAELTALQPPYDEMVRLKGSLGELQNRVQPLRSNAELFTYLRHPWPRTQLLAALADPLPKEVTIDQIQFATEARTDLPPAEQLPQGDRKAEEEKLRKAPPSHRDLRRLRAECDKVCTWVRVAGTTSETAALYGYLGALNKTGMFLKANLRSIESAETPQGPTLRFQVVLAVRPGYGQPGGPHGKPENPSQDCRDGVLPPDNEESPDDSGIDSQCPSQNPGGRPSEPVAPDGSGIGAKSPTPPEVSS